MLVILVLAVGIIGATVMPHNLYLHSSIVQTRAYGEDERARHRALKLATIDSTVALGLAFLLVIGLGLRGSFRAERSAGRSAGRLAGSLAPAPPGRR